MKNPKDLKKWALNYIQDNKKYIIIASIIYFVIFLFYFIFFLFYREQVPGESRILDGVTSRNILLQSVDFGFIIKAWWNKVLLFFGILIFGFTFSLGAILYIFVDTSLLGLSLARFIQYDYINQIYIILIHQFFSLPIILVALALSLKITVLSYKKIFKKTDINYLKEIQEIFQFYFVVVIPLFFITYLVEVLVLKFLF